MYNYKTGNMYSLEKEDNLEKQIEECAEHMFLKYGLYPDLAFINPKNMGEEERKYKTSTGKYINLIPDDKQLQRSFVLAVKGT